MLAAVTVAVPVVFSSTPRSFDRNVTVQSSVATAALVPSPLPSPAESVTPSSFTDTRVEVLERIVSVGAAEEDDTTPLVSSVSRCHGEARALFVAGKVRVPLKSPVRAMMRPEVTSSWAETKLLERTRTRALLERGEEERAVRACGKWGGEGGRYRDVYVCVCECVCVLHVCV